MGGDIAMSYSEDKKRALQLRKRAIKSNIPSCMLNLSDYYLGKALYCRRVRTQKQSGYDEFYCRAIRLLEQSIDVLLAYLNQEIWDKKSKWLENELSK